MPPTESPKRVQFVENGSVKTVEVSCRGTVQNTDKDTIKVVSTPVKHKVISQSRRGEGLWRVPFLV